MCVALLETRITTDNPPAEVLKAASELEGAASLYSCASLRMGEWTVTLDENGRTSAFRAERVEVARFGSLADAKAWARERYGAPCWQEPPKDIAERHGVVLECPAQGLRIVRIEEDAS